MSSHRRWTQADITDLRAKLLAGATVDEISDAMGRTADEVRLMMGRLRLRIP